MIEQGAFAQEAAHARWAHARAAQAGEAEGIFFNIVGAGGEARVVDAHAADFEPRGDGFGFLPRVGEDRGGQAVVRIVGRRDRLVGGIIGRDCDHRPEGLLAHDEHVAADFAHHRGAAPVAAAVMLDFAAAMHPRAAGAGIVEMPADRRGLAGEDQRAEFPGVDVAVIELDVRRGRYQRGEKIVVNRAGDIGALQRLASLAGGAEGAAGDGAHGVFQVRPGGDDGGVLAAEFEKSRDEPPRRLHGHLASGGDAAGEADRVHFINERGAGGAVAGDKAEHRMQFRHRGDAFGQRRHKTRSHLAGFDDHRAAGEQRGYRIERRQRQRKVPRADDANERVGRLDLAPIDRGRHIRLARLAREYGRCALQPVIDQIDWFLHFKAGNQPPAGIGRQGFGERLAAALDFPAPGEQRQAAVGKAFASPFALGAPQLAGEFADCRRRPVVDLAIDAAVPRVPGRDGVHAAR